MELTKYSINSCCGKKSVIYKIDRPITNDLLNIFLSLGFKELSHFTKAGILYVENSDFIITGPMGSNKLQIKCRIANCDSKLQDFQTLAKTF